MKEREQVIDEIFAAREKNGCWKMLPEYHKYYPAYLHYVPNFKAALWSLILLADIGCEPDRQEVKVPLDIIGDHFFDPGTGIFSLKEDHFPIPCLNGNMIYLDCYFNGTPGEKSLKALDFFCTNQRFDDGEYKKTKSVYCKNTSCYGKHTCYWGIIKLLKGISFIPPEARSAAVKGLLERCIDFVLLHKVCFSSNHEHKIMIKGIDKPTFPNMYKSDFLEILWLLKREEVRSPQLEAALDLLRSKQQPGPCWHLEKKVSNMTASVGSVGRPNRFVTERAREVLDFYT